MHQSHVLDSDFSTQEAVRMSSMYMYVHSSVQVTRDVGSQDMGSENWGESTFWKPRRSKRKEYNDVLVHKQIAEGQLSGGGSYMIIAQLPHCKT